jgi:hypothetical protein
MMRWSAGSNTDEEDALVAAIVAMHRKKQATEDRAAGGYAGVVRHFERRGQRLRAERLVTEELVSRLLAGGRALPQPREHREITLVGPAQEVAAGRIRVANRTSDPASFELVSGDAVDGARHPSLTFEPRAGELAPGQTHLVRVEASLAGFAPGETVTVPVELRFRLGFDRIWVVVRAESEGRP